MEITLHDSIRQLAGTSIIKYTNNSPDSLDRIFLHLYPNAFQIGSVKHREYTGNYGRGSRAKYFKEKLDQIKSKIDVRNFSIAVPNEGLSWIHKKSILGSYTIDDTVLEVILSKKIAPGQVARIDLEWTHHVGEMVERAGYYEGQYNMAQWYPKVAVYDEDGWHSDVFHAEGEFYGEFGNFNVKFNLPKTFVIAASGIVKDGDPGWQDVRVDTSFDFFVWRDIYDSTYIAPELDQRRHVTFLAENVHDFAWVASKDFFYEGGKSKDKETEIHVLYDRNRGDVWSKVVLERSIEALNWLEEKFGNYPYPQITTVDRVKNGGMEYPMLVMNGREDESLIVHEYGHVYFYGILANNELDEAWLDEGFTTYQTTEYMMQKYGDHGFDPKLYSGYDKFPKKFWPKQNELQSDQWSAIRFQSSGHNENISKPSYLFNSGSSYSRNAYTKPALMLSELKYFLEDSLFYAVMQSYFDQWQFKHTNEKRFIETVEKVVGQDMGWFFNPWLHTTRDLDYGIKSFEKSYDKNFWNINLEIENKGSRFLPIKIETLFSDGTKENRWWTNHLWRFDDTLSYRVNKKPIKITLDPDVQTMDLDFRNNTTRMNKKIIFNWPGLDYSPRDEIVYKWNPNFYFYKRKKDFSPGFYIEKNYGFYEKTFMSINYSMKSKNIYWDFNSSRQLVHYFPRTKFNFWTFNKPGVLEYGGELEKKWNKVYGSTPTQTYSIGFYLQPKYDGLRSQALGYDELHSKKLGVGYLDFSTTIGVSSLEINSATSLGALSDWNFNRFTFESYTSFSKVLSRHNKTKPDKNKIKLNLKNRFIVGKIWSDKAGAPSQEAFNIEGNSSNEQLRKRYIVDQFYGNTDLFNHYHLSGDGNLRGFTGMSLENADALVSTSNELGFFTTMPKINLSTEIIAFADGGVFLNEDPFKKRYLGDAGFGVRFDTSFFEKDIYIRLDFPFIIYDDNSLSLDWNNWIFSFQRSM
tara:strand:+ start:2715 stop:5627 length:2913 start_codon:yes stop_codon:yes gene_type:complete